VKKNGASTLELLMWLLGAVGAVTAYAHMTFITYREVAPRLDRIENKIDSILEKGLKGE
jgi:hypothetical protein